MSTNNFDKFQLYVICIRFKQSVISEPILAEETDMIKEQNICYDGRSKTSIIIQLPLGKKYILRIYWCK